MAARDFWGELQEIETKTLLSIMREQAALLGPKTNNLVETRVETQVHGSKFVHAFKLVAPALDNYTYELFIVEHGIELYPVYNSDLFEDLKNETEFTDWLQKNLASPQTRKVLSNLIAQSRN